MVSDLNFKKAEWFDEECKEHKNDVKRLLKQYKKKRSEKSRQSYTNANKVYRYLITQKKNQFCKRKAASLAASIKNSSDFWKEVRACCGERKPELSEKIERQGWFDHFQQLFSQADGGSSRECSELVDEVSEILDLDSDVLNQPISEAEVRAAVSKLKTGKATFWQKC